MQYTPEDIEEMIDHLVGELIEFLSGYSEHIDVHNSSVQVKLEALARAAVESISDDESSDSDEEDNFLSYQGDMDQYEDESDS
jgi:hypothetical protein